MCVLNPRTPPFTQTGNQIAAKITQNSGISFVFCEQILIKLRLVFCANVSDVIPNIWGNFQGKVGGEFMCNRRQMSQAAGSY